MSDTTNPKDALGEKKPPVWLVPAAATLVEAEVFRLGAAKYGPYNWREKKVRATVYVAAAMRHIFSYLDGEDTDPESGQTHVAHARACMGILIDAAETGNLIDDRPTKGAAAPLIHRLTRKDPPVPSLNAIRAAMRPPEGWQSGDPCSTCGGNDHMYDRQCALVIA